MRAYVSGAAHTQPRAVLCPFERHSEIGIHDGVTLRHVRRIPGGFQDVLGVGEREGIYSSEDATILGGIGEQGPIGVPLWEDDEEDEGATEIRGRRVTRVQDPPSRTATEVAVVQERIPRQAGASFVAAEINRTMAYFSRIHGEERMPENLVVLGPSPAAEQFVRELAPVVQIRLLAAPHPSSLHLADAGSRRGRAVQTSEYLAAVGAAVGAAGLRAGIDRLNIAQQEPAAKVRRRAPAILLAGMAGSSLWMVCAAAAAIWIALLESNEHAYVARLTTEITSLKEARAPAVAYHEQLRSVQILQRRTTVPASAVLGRLAESYREGLQLTSVKISPDGKVAIEGRALSTTKVQQFALEVGRGIAIRLPVIESLKRDTGGVLSFRVTGMFKEPAIKQTGGE